MVEKGKQKLYSTPYTLSRAGVILQYHIGASYSFEVGTHKLGHPFEAVSSTSHKFLTLFKESQVPGASLTGRFVAD